MTAATLALELFLMICVGYYAGKRKLVGEHFSKDLAAFITNIALPCLIIKSMQVPFSASELRSCLNLLLLAVGFLAVSVLIAQIAYRLSPRDHRGRILRFGLIFTNFTFMGIPVIETLYGTTGVFHFVVFLVPLRITLYTLAKPLLSPPGTAGAKKSVSQIVRGLLSPPLVAVIIGLTLYIAGISLSGIIGQTVDWLASVTSPMGMVLCGITLSRYPFKALMRMTCLRNALLRCFFMPGLIWVLCCLLRLDSQLSQIVVMTAAMPISSTSIIYTINYDPEPDAHFECAGSVLLSTLLCSATIPLWAWLISLI